MHSWLQRPALPINPIKEVTISLAEASHFWGKHRPSQLAAGKDGVTNPEESCQYCKDMGHLLENCPQLESRDQFRANQEKMKEGLN